MKKEMKRRELLKGTIASIGVLGLTTLTAKAEDMCRLTSGQPEGPFYPIEDQFDKDNDLTLVHGKSARALGEVVILKGVIRDQNCKPIKGALVEIWQACETGKYNHPGDPNNSKLDPNFQYWGRMLTNEKGEYFFKTIKPGSYQATSDWIRPPHIHMKAHLRGFEELTTQVYFKEEKVLNNRDRILVSLNQADQKDVTIDFKKVTPLKPREGQFDIILKSF